MRHRVYKLLRLGVNFLPDSPLEIMGIFAEVGKEAETGSSKCKLSPRSFLGYKPPALKFSALLTEGGAERLELTRM